MHDLMHLHPAAGDRGRWLARADVRVKWIVGLATIVAVVLSHRPALPAAVCLLCSAGALAAGLPLRSLLKRLAAPLLLAAAVAAMQLFMTPGETWFTIRPFGARWTATQTGAALGGLLAVRVLGSVAVALLLCSFTPAWQIFAAMRWARWPRTWVEIAMLMYRHIFTLFESASAVRAAQRVRLGYATWRQSIRSAGGLAGTVVLRAIDQAERTHEAMTARGYRGSLHIAPLPPLGWRNALVAAGGVVAMAVALVLCEGWIV